MINMRKRVGLSRLDRYVAMNNVSALEGLQSADGVGRRIRSNMEWDKAFNQGMVTPKKKERDWLTGTWIAYKRPGEKLGPLIWYMDKTGSGLWCAVPEQHKLLVGAALVFEHPNYTTSEVITTKMSKTESLDTLISWYKKSLGIATDDKIADALFQSYIVAARCEIGLRRSKVATSGLSMGNEPVDVLLYPDPAKVEVIERFAELSFGWYGRDPKHGIPCGDKKESSNKDARLIQRLSGSYVGPITRPSNQGGQFLNAISSIMDRFDMLTETKD